MPKRVLTGPFLKFLPVFMIAMLICSCVSVPVNKLPAPEPTAKLRVMVLPVTGPFSRGNWATSEEEYARRAYIRVGGFLQETGIYEVIPESDLEKAIGRRPVQAWEWKAGDWSLARKVGEAVHADYIFIAEREDAGLLYYRMIFINRETGRQYMTGGTAAKQHDWFTTSAAATVVVKQSYGEIFSIAKADLFETAVRKGRMMRDRSAAPALPETSVAKPAREKPAAVVPESRKPAQAQSEKESAAGRVKLVVYDFKADKHMEVVSLILSDALREELFSLGPFVLVNRENINQVVDELKLQQSGLVDEKQAVRIGDWLAANEMVTGNLAALGQVYVLSAKRTDIGTLKALGMGSVKCAVGKEEDLLTGIPEIARKLAGTR